MPQKSFLPKKPTFIIKTIAQMEKSVLRLAKYRWILILIALFVFMGIEFSEFQLKISDYFHVGEIAVNVLLLMAVGSLIEMVLRAHRSQNRTLKLLEYKHYLSLELMPYQNWDSLVGSLTERLAKIVNANEAYLFVQDPIMDDLEHVAEWIDGETVKEGHPDVACQVCVARNDPNILPHGYCKFPADQPSPIQPRAYCFPIYYRNNPFALIRFVLKPGQSIMREQRRILKNVSDEVVIALMAGRDRKRLSELELAEATLAERHTVSQYLHDGLSQNIGYLRMKVDDLAEKTNQDTKIHSELRHMKAVLDESYMIVRNKLEDIHPKTLPILNNFLHEHARKISKRANFDIDFVTQGVPQPVSIDVQRAVFYVFQEALSNIEKHARASTVKVLINWDNDNLSITISDDGIGFNPRNTDTSKHFGLEIARERANNVRGNIEIMSSENSGTTIKIGVPLSARNREFANV